MQVQFYAIGLREVGRPVGRASVANILDNAVHGAAVSEERLHAARTVAEGAVTRILERDFRASPGKHCKDCWYGGICGFKQR